MTAAAQLQELLALKTAPVAVAFLAKAPANVPRASAAGPSSCTYWKRAAEGQTFYTEAADQLNCPIGAYTHGVDMPAAQQQELQGVVATMVSLGYLRMAEVPGIPKRDQPFGVAVYAPLKKTPVEPDVILVTGNARQMMLLEEAAQSAGVGGGAPLMGRPTCAALPAAMKSQKGIASLGCIGNRVYTEMSDDELYYALPGKHLAAVVGKLAEIVNANRELEKYHRARV
ncbi:MAG: DUF169 domain-containing protein [Planctomycetes bacterium]|nr:DUF169 domain-containing protein [Planctomycetota bacterium]